MTIALFERTEFFVDLRDEFSVEAVALSFLSKNKTVLTHYVLTKSHPEVETISLPKDPLVCVIPVIANSEIVACPSISRTNGKLDCPVMRAEGLEAILSVPLFVDLLGATALSVMNAKPRIWNKSEAKRLGDVALSLEQSAA